MITYKIADYIKKSGKSYRALAKDLGLAYVTVFKLANATNDNDYEIGTRTLDKLCKYFKVGVNNLLKWSPK